MMSCDAQSAIDWIVKGAMENHTVQFWCCNMFNEIHSPNSEVLKVRLESEPKQKAVSVKGAWLSLSRCQPFGISKTFNRKLCSFQKEFDE